MRTGLGYDLHKLVRGRKLMLGGVHIPFKKGEAAHSDGDVLLHAVTDSILGASGMGDIGEFFPPEDKTWKNADSAELLKIVREKINGAGWKIENIDCVILIEKPKILPYREIIRESIADILKIKKDSVFVKAKTGEGLGIIGRGRAVASFVSSLLTRT
ncbi:2-C-methyl-D-erythritol 2,4-cyclodiphosphate synthase [Treponema pedis]|uniref:2-C-methyl-D-erythritol 2,4-cyclodiphosphate synthase n=1 Tax=Treponema pedis str. T A4 TaxID=1291379 RepID=S6A4E7_9SPIR|nr:2-C-methyl-D-erythritol 2,4-cyclodiphosphate synthase [Treponema pedis]AGT44381.1 2-C-methyl-D-erythritol 2,4-cyclodiphosphate synthase [Treponema pedis str. T A4]